MSKITVIGHFGFSDSDVNLSGQIIKTKIVAHALENRFGAENVDKVDTRGGIKVLFRARSMIRSAFRASSDVIIMPAQNGLRVFAPLCASVKAKFPDVKLHYVVIGGWLADFIGRYRFLEKHLKKFDAIYVETSSMKKALEIMGFSNAVVMPNCKDLRVLKKEELVYSTSEPLKLCTFSRVMKEKGIEDAVRAVEAVNKKLGRTVYGLDIYGQVESGQEEWFDRLKQSFMPFVRYMGVIPFDRSADVIKDYFALLFPTRFYTEGIPGTVIDAFAAGVPVISSKWENFSDIIEDGSTGTGYKFGDAGELERVLRAFAEDPGRAMPMKEKCLSAAKRYTTEEAVKILRISD